MKVDISMALGVVRGYVAWWLGVHLVDLGMDEDEEEEETAMRGFLRGWIILGEQFDGQHTSA